MDCLFCKIINKEVTSYILYEDDDVMAFLDAYPTSNGHTLVIPKKHATTIDDVDSETLIKMFEVAGKLKDKLMNKLDKKAISYLINYGESQMIKHLHLHLIPNFNFDKEKIKEPKEIYEILKDD